MMIPLIVGAAVLAVILSLALVFNVGDENQPSKERLGRALRGGVPAPQTQAERLSIVRRRSELFRLSQSRNYANGLVELALWLEQLISCSGLSLTMPQLGLVIAVKSLILTTAMVVFAGLGIVLAAGLGVALATGLVLFFLTQRKAKQLRAFQTIFPEALDLIVRSVRAGLPVSEAVRLIADDVADPVGPAFREVGANLAIGLSLDEALTILRKRVPISEVKFFVISLTIQQETGGNLAEILANLASIMRKRVQVEKKVKAMSSEARASALIIGSLPFIVGCIISIFNREYIETLFVDETGQWFLAAALGSMAFGALVMRKLIRLEV